MVTFSELPPANDWLFDLGIAAPPVPRLKVKAGAIRYCNFTTGPFVEPITEWDEPYVLAFDVTKQPPPMKELSPYDIHPPHLDGHLESKRGEFRLERLEGNRTQHIQPGTSTTCSHLLAYLVRLWWKDSPTGIKHVKNLSEVE